MSKQSELVNLLDRLSEADEDRYSWLPIGNVEAISVKAALLRIERKGDVWFPLSQLRELDGDIYASHWILDQKGVVAP